MSKFSQLLKMINYLEGKQEPTKRKEIAEHLGVSDRMIRKYIDDIKESECYNITSISGAKGGIILTPKEPRPKENKSQKGIEITKDEKVYLQSMLTLNAFDIQRELIRLHETEFRPRRYEKTLETLKKQNQTIDSIFKKLCECQ